MWMAHVDGDAAADIAVHAEQWHRGLRTGCGTDTMHCTSSRGGGGLDCGGEMADSGEGRGGGSGESCGGRRARREEERRLRATREKKRKDTWLILPVVICLS
jgi:hypothetical protein